MQSDYALHVDFIEEVMRAGVRMGILKEMDPPMMAAALTGIVNSYASKWIALAAEDSLTKKTPFVLAIFLEGVRNNAQ